MCYSKAFTVSSTRPTLLLHYFECWNWYKNVIRESLYSVTSYIYNLHSCLYFGAYWMILKGCECNSPCSNTFVRLAYLFNSFRQVVKQTVINCMKSFCSLQANIFPLNFWKANSRYADSTKHIVLLRLEWHSLPTFLDQFQWELLNTFNIKCLHTSIQSTMNRFFIHQ